MSEVSDNVTDIRLQTHTGDAPTVVPKPPVYVKLRADVFGEMLEVMAFYATQGWDHGKRARDLMDRSFNKEPA